MDRIIQDNDPLFMLVWLGAVVLLIAATAVNAIALEGSDRWLLIVALATYLLGVQAPTITVNIPLNNRLQALDVEALGPADLKSEREAFEARWVFWNRFRTAVGVITVMLLLGVWL
jgi:uncharacterized membrane protein